MELQVSSHECDGARVVSVAGELDALSVPELDAHVAPLLEVGYQRVVLDLSGVEFMDSTGLGICIKVLKGVRDAGGDMSLVATSPRVLRVLEITGIDQAISVAETVDEAVALLGGDN